MERFFIDAYGPDAEAERDGVEWLIREAQQRGTPGAIVVPAVDSIRNLGRAIGLDVAAFAEKNRYFTMDGMRVEVFSTRTKPTRFQGPVLVPWSSEAMVNAAEEMAPSAICAIPWTDSDLETWKRAWNPIDPRTGEPIGEEAVAVSSASVERGLESLTAAVNMSTGIHHPSDERHAKRLFKALQLCGERLDETEIRTWAISHGWEPRHADDLAQLARKIAAGRRVRGAAMNKTEAKQIVRRLRDSS